MPSTSLLLLKYLILLEGDIKTMTMETEKKRFRVKQGESLHDDDSKA